MPIRDTPWKKKNSNNKTAQVWMRRSIGMSNGASSINPNNFIVVANL
jgi:hypothetical protein